MSQVRKTPSSSATRAVIYDFGQARARSEPVEAAAPADSAGISAEARALSRAHTAVRDASDLREERIQALKATIANGTYSPDPREIARKIIANGL
jgi:negative regulator of flagellin synthesis FlgM